MSDKRRAQKELFIEDYIQELKDAGTSVAARGRSTQKSAEEIMSSLNIPGTKGEVHKGMLLAKVANLEKLTVFYNSVSRRLFSAADKMANGIPEEEVTADIVAYNKFLTDQLKSEEDDNQHILDILQHN